MRYDGKLPDNVYTYNHSINRSIKVEHVNVNAQNEKSIWHTLYDDNEPTKAQYKFKVGDHVTISKIKRTFEKGYLPNFSKKNFTIRKQISRDPPVYKIKDYDGEELQR